MKRIKTNVSSFGYVGKAGERVSTLDDLFNGGLLLPDGPGARPILMLLSGPPGSGKSTLALEIAYRATCQDESGEVVEPSAFYHSLEAPSDWIIQHAREGYGWDEERSVFHPLYNEPIPVDDKVVLVHGSNDLWVDEPSQPQVATRTRDRLAEVKDVVRSLNPGVVILDGFNILGLEDQKALFNKLCREYLDPHRVQPLLLMIVLDSPGSAPDHRHWEYVCDVMVSLGGHDEDGYFLRWLEIVKARHQSHAWGKHRLKMRSRPSRPQHNPFTENIDIFPAPEPEESRTEGGISIFPSVHRALSRVRQSKLPSRRERGHVPTPYPELNDIIAPEGAKKGLPEGRCTALIGERGAMKSHIAYHIALEQSRDRRVTILSLRDDVHATQETLANIAKWEGLTVSRENLRIVYFWPGYISAEQVYHTISMEITGRQDRPELVCVVGLDRLGGRFPLCARESVFVPALISLLNRWEITSVVTSTVNETEQTGRALLPMADLVLRFDSIPDSQDMRVQATRVPRGEIGRRSAIASRDANSRVVFASDTP